MNFTASIRAEALLARLGGSSDALAAEMRRVLTKLSIEVQAAVKEEKLTGQVLHARTGTLRRSINRKVFEDAAGFFAQVGTNVKYAAVHEYGFNGTVNVRDHIRKVTSRDTYGYMPTSQTKKVTRIKLVKTSEGFARVRAHTRNMNMPARSFLRSTVKEMFPRIQRELKAAALRALK